MRLLTILLLLSTLTLHAATTPLTKAIRLENFEEAKKHLTPELVNKPDGGLYHPLTYAVYTGNNDLIEALLKAGANPNTVEHNGKTALYFAAKLRKPETIKLLHKHGAKYPKSDSPYQPAKAAVKANSPAALETLLKLYPQLDLQAGWKKPTSGLWWPGSPLNHAAIEGYNEIGSILLKNECDLSASLWRGPNIYTSGLGIDQRGRKALHIAAENPKCSIEFVKALITSGCDPFEDSYGWHFQRRTPFQYAAAAGSLEKFKLLMRGYNPNDKEQRNALGLAYFCAAAYNREEVVDYILTLLKHPITPPEKWLEKHGDKLSAQDGHNPLRESEIRTFSPLARAKPISKEANGSVAIISSPELRNTASLLTAILSSKKLNVLERDQTKTLSLEAILKSFDNLQEDSFQRQLKLIPAEHLILITNKKHKNGNFIELSTVSCLTGVVISRVAISINQSNNADYLNLCSNQILQKIILSQSSSKKSQAISVNSIKPEIPDYATLLIAQDANVILPYHISNTPSCTQLTRKQLSHLEMENAIGGKGSYWSAAWTIDGSIAVRADGAYYLKLFATSTSSLKKLTVTQDINLKKPNDAVRLAWQKLSEKIKLPSPLIPEKTDRLTEARILKDNALWFHQAGYFDEAVTSAKTAIILGLRDVELFEALISSQMNALPINRSSVCSHIKRNPRALEPKKKYLLARRHNEYEALLDSCIHFASYITHLPPQKQATAYKIYRESLYKVWAEISLYRTISDDVILSKFYSARYKMLDSKAIKLINIHQKVTKGDLKDIINLTDIDPYSYFYQKLPTTHDKLVRSYIQDLSRRKDAWKFKREIEVIGATMINNISYCKRHQIDYSRWVNMMNDSLELKCFETIPNLFIYASQHCLNPESAHKFREKALRLALEHKLDLISSETGYNSKWLQRFYPEIEPRIYNHNDKFLRETILKVLNEPVLHLENTAEIKRQWYLYRWLRKHQEAASDSIWMSRIRRLKKADEEKKQPPLTNHNAIVWEFYKKCYLSSTSKPNYEILKILDKHTSTKQTVGTITPLDTNLMPISPATGTTSMKFSIKERFAKIVGDEVWIPAHYTPLEKDSPSISESKSYIQILNLKSNITKSIALPICITKYNPTFIFGENYVYLHGYNPHSRRSVLYVISRTTYSAKEIQLPLPKIHDTSATAIDDSICVSVSERNRDYDNNNVTSQVILIKGEDIVKTLISNKRKPYQSPLDRPNVLVTRIDHRKNQIKFYSRHDMTYINPRSMAGAVYSTRTSEWNPIAHNAIVRHSRASMRYITSPRRKPDKILNIGGRYFYLFTLEDTASDSSVLAQKSFGISTTLRHTPLDLHTPPYTLNLGFFREYFHRKFFITPKPASSPFFNTPFSFVKSKSPRHGKKLIVLDEGSHKIKGFWLTANEIIKYGYYKTHVVGKWHNQIILALHHNKSGLHALWLVSEKELTEAIKDDLNRIQPPITFDHLDVGPITRIESPKAVITAAPEHISIRKNMGCENTRCVKVAGGKNRVIKITATNNSDGFESIFFFVRRWSYKKPFTLRVSAKIDGEWKEFADGDNMLAHDLTYERDPKVKVAFPSKVKEIKITLSTPEKTGAVIDDICLK